MNESKSLTAGELGETQARSRDAEFDLEMLEEWKRIATARADLFVDKTGIRLSHLDYDRLEYDILSAISCAFDQAKSAQSLPTATGGAPETARVLQKAHTAAEEWFDCGRTYKLRSEAVDALASIIQQVFETKGQAGDALPPRELETREIEQDSQPLPLRSNEQLRMLLNVCHKHRETSLSLDVPCFVCLLREINILKAKSSAQSLPTAEGLEARQQRLNAWMMKYSHMLSDPDAIDELQTIAAMQSLPTATGGQDLGEPDALQDRVEHVRQKTLSRPTVIGWWWLRFPGEEWRPVEVDEVDAQWGGGLRCLTHRMRDNGNSHHAWKGEWSGPISGPSVSDGDIAAAMGASLETPAPPLLAQTRDTERLGTSDGKISVNEKPPRGTEVI